MNDFKARKLEVTRANIVREMDGFSSYCEEIGATLNGGAVDHISILAHFNIGDVIAVNESNEVVLVENCNDNDNDGIEVVSSKHVYDGNNNDGDVAFEKVQSSVSVFDLGSDFKSGNLYSKSDSGDFSKIDNEIWLVCSINQSCCYRIAPRLEKSILKAGEFILYNCDCYEFKSRADVADALLSSPEMMKELAKIIVKNLDE